MGGFLDDGESLTGGPGTPIELHSDQGGRLGEVALLRFCYGAALYRRPEGL